VTLQTESGAPLDVHTVRLADGFRFLSTWPREDATAVAANVVSLCLPGASVCGDGTRHPLCERCDAGVGNSDTTPDACRTDCRPAHCGDGTTDTTEECDDGNTDDCDGCSSACHAEIGLVCGDGIPYPACGQSCDDGNLVDRDGCSATCALERIPGGSGGGSAAAVASFQAPLGIGTDTGGSIRQPAAVTGTVGVKPTYGTVSRYGLVALASSLDQAGPCARTVLDAALLHAVVAGHDPLDSTSIDAPVPPVVEAARQADVRGMRVGVVRELTGEGYQTGVQQRFDEAVAILREIGAEVVEVSCPHFPYALAAYYLILPSEASSNLAKFDGMRFGLRVGDDGTRTTEQVMARTRAAGFGDEVVRRIILGTYALSAGYYDAYYGSAQKVRTLVQRDFAAAFEQVDVLVSPTAPTTAFRFGEKLDDPLAMYLNDVATIPANLAGTPGLSLPAGLAPEDGLPVGLQVMAPALADDRLYRVGAAVEAALLDRWGAPLLDSAPALAQVPA
jgi:aspartyl-tRNA(Asn)/glutamyl-tRNA(Gln) amidotransferase subunit A